MYCAERSQMLEHCATTVHTLTRVSIKWQELVGNPNTSEYRDSRDVREQARREVDLAYGELERHESRHRCQLPCGINDAVRHASPVALDA